MKYPKASPSIVLAADNTLPLREIIST